MDELREDVSYSLISAYVVTNNIRVFFSAFALGIPAVIIFRNGATIGALGGYLLSNGLGMLGFWFLILPHRFLELGAIFLKRRLRADDGQVNAGSRKP